MDPWAALMVVLVIVLGAHLAAIIRRQPAAPQAVPTRKSAKDGLAKIAYLIDHCHQSLDPAKLHRGNDRYTSYYIGYLYEVARFIADDGGFNFSTAFQTPVLLEAIRLCGGERAANGGRLIPAVLASPAGREGAVDGRADAAQAMDDRNSGPYWSRIHGYFEAARSDA